MVHARISESAGEKSEFAMNRVLEPGASKRSAAASTNAPNTPPPKRSFAYELRCHRLSLLGPSTGQCSFSVAMPKRTRKHTRTACAHRWWELFLPRGMHLLPRRLGWRKLEREQRTTTASRASLWRQHLLLQRAQTWATVQFKLKREKRNA